MKILKTAGIAMMCGAAGYFLMNLIFPPVFGNMIANIGAILQTVLFLILVLNRRSYLRMLDQTDEMRMEIKKAKDENNE